MGGFLINDTINRLYETYFGLHDHLSDEYDSPLAPVAHHPLESLDGGDKYESELTDFILLKITKHTGLDWKSYMSLPRHKCNSIKRVVRKIIEDTNSEGGGPGAFDLDDLDK